MRLERLLAILMVLLNRKRISAVELADQMEVSVRTIYRDIDTLGQAGFPLVSYPGAGGGFAVMDGYRIDRNALTFEELASVTTALKGLNKTLGDSRLVATIEKYDGLLRETEKKTAHARQERLIIDVDPWSLDSGLRRKVDLLREAVLEERRVRFLYTDARNTASSREVEPMTLLLKGTAWYLHAYCLTRGDFRMFRLSRISELEATGDPFERREQPPLEGADWGQLWDRGAPAVAMKLRFQPDARIRAEEAFGVDQVRAAEDGSFRVEVSYPEDEWVYGFLLSFGDQVEVLEPDRLRVILRDRAEQIWKKYETSNKP